MSRFKKVSLFLDWSPTLVRAIDRAGNEVARSSSISGLKGQVTGTCALILGRRSSYLKAARLPNARASEINSIIRIQAAQLFPNAIGELTYSFFLTNDVDGEGRLAILAAASVSLLVDLYAEASAIGLDIAGAIPVAFGSMFVARTSGIQNCGVIESTVDGIAIDIVNNSNVIYSRVPPSGSDLATEIERTFAAASVPSSPILALGPSPFAHPDHASPIGAAQAVVAAIEEAETLALEPPKLAQKRLDSQVSTRARLASLMALAAIGVAAVVWDGRDRAAEFAQKNQAEYTNALRAATKVRDTQLTRSSKFNSVALEVKRAFEPAQTPGDVLTAVGNEAPSGVWLTGITFERGKDLMLRGTAVSNEAIGAYVDKLNQNSRFSNVKLAFANQALIESTNVVQFSMTAHVLGNFPTVKTKKERGRK